MTTPTARTPATVVTGRLGRPSSPGAQPAPLLPELDVSTTCGDDVRMTGQMREETWHRRACTIQRAVAEGSKDAGLLGTS